jgi:cation:H+ antiporter
MIFIFWSVKKSRIEMSRVEHVFAKARFSVAVSVLLLLVSSAGLYFGATWLVDSAEAIA